MADGIVGRPRGVVETVPAAGRIVRDRGTDRGPGIDQDRGSAIPAHHAATVEEEHVQIVVAVVRLNLEEVANAVDHR